MCDAYWFGTSVWKLFGPRIRDLHALRALVSVIETNKVDSDCVRAEEHLHEITFRFRRPISVGSVLIYCVIPPPRAKCRLVTYHELAMDVIRCGDTKVIQALVNLLYIGLKGELNFCARWRINGYLLWERRKVIEGMRACTSMCILYRHRLLLSSVVHVNTEDADKCGVWN